MPPPPRMPTPKATIIYKKSVVIQKIIPKLKKAFHYFVEHVETNLLIFDESLINTYSRLAIRLKFFWFLPNIR